LFFDKDSSLNFNYAKVEMDDYFSPLDFSNINGYPHAIPKKDIEKSPSLCSHQSIFSMY
jgi:hypothetical protein